MSGTLRRFFFLVSLAAISQNAAFAGIAPRTYFDLVKTAEDVLVMRVARIKGPTYEHIAVSHVEESLKGVVRKDSIDLPFAYASYPGGEGVGINATGIFPVTFEAGKLYLVMLQKHPIGSYDPNLAKTDYEVIQDSAKTQFELNGNTVARLELIRTYARLALIANIAAVEDTLVSLTSNDSAFVRLDAMQTLDELKYANPEPAMKLLREDTDEDVRAAAALELSHSSDPKTADGMIDCAMKERSPAVLDRIISSLDTAGAGRTVPVFLTWYDTAQTELQNTIIAYVARARDTTAVDSLLRFYTREQNVDRRKALLKDIAGFPCVQAIEFTSRLLASSKDPRTMAAIIEGWGESGVKARFKDVAAWANYPWPKPRRGSVADAPAIEALEFAVLDALQELGTPEQLLSTLPRYLKNTNRDIRVYIVSMLNALLENKLSPEQRGRTKNLIHRFGGE